MNAESSQLSLPLAAENSYLPAFYVPHSGVARALDTLRSALTRREQFSFFRLCGPRGAGKTHLMELIRFEAAEIEGLSLEIFDGDVVWSEESNVRRFIDSYERLKREGGLLLCACDAPDNPHVSSRFAFAAPLELEYPAEEELRPVVTAILERRGLRFPDAQIDYLLERLPASPLSLSDIFAKIDRLSLARGKQPNRAVFREVLQSEALRGETEKENE